MALQESGFEVNYAFDSDLKARDTFRLNFPNTETFCEDAEAITAMHDRDLKVDLLHLSPSCQPFSSARIFPSDRDEADIAASMLIGALLDKFKPRIATMENTASLWERWSPNKHGVDVKDCWEKILHQFTSRGFSVHHKILKVEQFGLPQGRRRLGVIASW